MDSSKGQSQFLTFMLCGLFSINQNTIFRFSRDKTQSLLYGLLHLISPGLETGRLLPQLLVYSNRRGSLSSVRLIFFHLATVNFSWLSFIMLASNTSVKSSRHSTFQGKITAVEMSDVTS